MRANLTSGERLDDMKVICYPEDPRATTPVVRRAYRRSILDATRAYYLDCVAEGYYETAPLLLGVVFSDGESPSFDIRGVGVFSPDALQDAFVQVIMSRFFAEEQEGHPFLNSLPDALENKRHPYISAVFLLYLTVDIDLEEGTAVIITDHEYRSLPEYDRSALAAIQMVGDVSTTVCMDFEGNLIDIRSSHIISLDDLSVDEEEYLRPAHQHDELLLPLLDGLTRAVDYFTFEMEGTD